MKICLVQSLETMNPLTIASYGSFDEVTWYGWFVIIYSLFVVVIIGSAVFMP